MPDSSAGANIINAIAFANNEVAFITWALDVEHLDGCLGFHILREYLDADGKVMRTRPLASYVAFDGQHNPQWQAQNTSIWPIQKFSWRDLTLRRRRDEVALNNLCERVRYRIRAVGRMRDGLEPVEPIASCHRDPNTGQQIQHSYEGEAIPLAYLTGPAVTNVIEPTILRPPFRSTFTNGILSTQYVVRMLTEGNQIDGGALKLRLQNPEDPLRQYLSGDVVQLIQDFFKRSGGRFYAALYELDDVELEALLVDNVDRLSLILSDAGDSTVKESNGKHIHIYDQRNQPIRQKLIGLTATNPNFFLQNRMFNGSGHIGHNKFVVWCDDEGTPQAVLTGSTNWTYGGVAAQSNNCIVIDVPDVAAQFKSYWERLQADVQPVPDPLTARVNNAQGDALKSANDIPGTATSDQVFIKTWFSPNMPGYKQVPENHRNHPELIPPDINHLFGLMRDAQQAIFFLVFMPSYAGVDSIVAEADRLGRDNPSLLVTGAISDGRAMPCVGAASPRVDQHDGVSIVQATALADKQLTGSLGDFHLMEKLKLGAAIIHDKILVLDPMDPKRCTVVFGSHNLGYKASYANDENLVIVRGHRDLALAYTAHVLDVYDHYRFRAVQVESADQKGQDDPSGKWSGFLDPTDGWQKNSSHRLADYFSALAKSPPPATGSCC